VDFYSKKLWVKFKLILGVFSGNNNENDFYGRYLGVYLYQGK
jgi:hypothetical protein